MLRGLISYLYRENTVVMEKSDVKNNPPDEDFRPVRLFIDEKHIRQWYKELEMAEEQIKQEMEDDYE